MPLKFKFADHVYEEIKPKAKEAVLQLIEKEREGELVDKVCVVVWEYVCYFETVPT